MCRLMERRVWEGDEGVSVCLVWAVFGNVVQACDCVLMCDRCLEC